MRLCDERGKELARLYIYEPQIAVEEMVSPRPDVGDTRSTDEVQEHLQQLCDSYVSSGNEFRVEWTGQSVHDLEAIWRELMTPPPTPRQRKFPMKFIRGSVNLIDRKLRAWTTLSSKWGDAEYVLRESSLAVLFRVDPGRSIVRVERIWRDAGEVNPQVETGNHPTTEPATGAEP
jgi:hypothetical protein